MTGIAQSYAVDGRPEVEVNIPAGDITLRQGAAGTVEVIITGSERALEGIEVEQLGRTVVVRHRGSGRRLFSRGVDVTIEMAADGTALLKTAAGDVKAAVPLTEVEVKVAAGDVRIGRVSGSCLVKSAAGSVVVDQAGEAQVTGASGDIRIDRVDGDVTATTASGDIVLGSFARDAVLKSASGDVVVERFDGIDLKAKSMSGTIRVGLPPGLAVEANLQSLSGAIRNEVAPSGSAPSRHARLNAKTLSGDIVLRSVEPGSAGA